MTFGQLAVPNFSEELAGCLFFVEVVKKRVTFWTTVALKMKAENLLETSIII
jgi:hypothetical protein